jgi:hypothetical protein
MTLPKSLIQEIRNEFGFVPFPSHCGLHAALTLDDRISDEHELREITQRDDYIGEWWDVPVEHLLHCIMALSYLDEAGMEFYLPAYMKAVAENPQIFDEPSIRSNSWRIVYAMLPDSGFNPELQQHFTDQFSRIHGGRKRVCREFLQHINKCINFDEYASHLAKKALSHTFWANDG